MPGDVLTEESLLRALEAVKDPDLGQSIVAMGMIKDVKIEDAGAKLAFTCELTTPACPVKEQIEKEIRDTVARAFPGVKALELAMTGKVRSNTTVSLGGGENYLPQIKNVVMVGAGKGGVGKSTVSVNLAAALKHLGATVGVLDLDVYGPSLPLMTGVRDKPKLQGETKIRPILAHGMEVMSMGFLVEPKQAMIWRGPILNGIVVQFLRDVLWSEADYLIVDLPPGTGDIPLSLAQSCASTGAVLVTTPQDVSLADVFRAKAMFDQMRTPVLGLIENMAGFYCPNCNHLHNIFKRGGGAEAAAEMQVPLLGEIPIEAEVSSSGDDGIPIVVRHPEGQAAKAFIAAAEKLAARISVQNLTGAQPAAAS
ncbi:MAG: Mrp/NBP35 family ATP-binding protein [Planctomycetota bacterium]|nr:Mrp/NBP35 family ATP-binding protein [Planctomycetota bacterium]